MTLASSGRHGLQLVDQLLTQAIVLHSSAKLLPWTHLVKSCLAERSAVVTDQDLPVCCGPAGCRVQMGAAQPAWQYWWPTLLQQQYRHRASAGERCVVGADHPYLSCAGRHWVPQCGFSVGSL